MEFISINFSLNSIYQIEKSVFKTVIEKATNKIEGLQYIDSSAVLTKRKDDISLTVEIKKKANVKTSIAYPVLVKEIEMLVFNLLDSKPKNIKVISK